MARIAALMELPSADLRRSQKARNGQGRDASPNGDVLVEQILGNGNTMHEEALKRIASLSPIRQSKVLTSVATLRRVPTRWQIGWIGRWIGYWKLSPPDCCCIPAEGTTIPRPAIIP
jgi:hypothetical protein